MSRNKMTLEYVLKAMAHSRLVAQEMVPQLLESAQEQERKLIRLKSRAAGKSAKADDQITAVDVLVSMTLPLPGRDGQTIDEETIMKAVARMANLPYRKLDPLELDLNVVTKTLPRNFALKHLVVPIGIAGHTLELATCDPLNHEVIEDVRRVAEYEVTQIISTKEDIRKIISEFYGFKSAVAGAEGQIAGPAVDLGNLEQYVRLKSVDEIQHSDKHVKNAVDFIFNAALDQRASDIHVEPKRNESLIRFRIDGVLHNIHRLPKVIHSAMVSRIKTISRLDIAEKRRPQDGRIKIEHLGREVEIRVSTIPVAFGEKVVMRLLDPDILFRSLSDLFFAPTDLSKFESFIRTPHGIILVTGPTGSGKSTTLYSSLRALSNEEINITTVEDPIEMIHEDFNQIAVQPLVGITFGTILRNILRQDPDIIMIGEMRDFETAENAIQAALTGHLVLSTLHTNDAPSAITRLTDLGAEPFLISSTVIGVMAQRLLRRICPHCIEEFYFSAEEVAETGLRVKVTDRIKLKRGAGCERCRNTGYLGRVATTEVMPFSDRLRQLAMTGEGATKLKKVARSEGMSTLRENAIRLMLKGETTFQEVLRVTVDD